MTDFGIRYTLQIDPEDSSFEDRDGSRDWIAAELNAGNQWAWCVATVTARVDFEGHAFEGNDLLGCCSFTSEEDFRQSGFYDDMCGEAQDRLLQHLRAVVANGARCARLLAALEETNG